MYAVHGREKASAQRRPARLEQNSHRCAGKPRLTPGARMGWCSVRHHAKGCYCVPAIGASESGCVSSSVQVYSGVHRWHGAGGLGPSSWSLVWIPSWPGSSWAHSGGGRGCRSDTASRLTAKWWGGVGVDTGEREREGAPSPGRDFPGTENLTNRKETFLLTCTKKDLTMLAKH